MSLRWMSLSRMFTDPYSAGKEILPNELDVYARLAIFLLDGVFT